MPGGGQTSRRNAVNAVGVRLWEAPGAPPGSAVRIRILSSQHRRTRPSRTCGVRRWVALVDIHLSGDIRTTRLAHRPYRPRVRPVTAARQARETANCTMTGLDDQGGSEGDDPRGAERHVSLAGDPTRWKDPL